MPKIEMINDTIEFAKELAYGIELNEFPPSEDEIYGALHLMDSQLRGSGDDTRALLSVEQAYLLPSCVIEAEFMEDQLLVRTTIDRSVIKARLHHFEWVSSSAVIGFGIRVFGVDIIEPVKKHEPTAFIPLQYVNLRLAA